MVGAADMAGAWQITPLRFHHSSKSVTASLPLRVHLVSGVVPYGMSLLSEQNENEEGRTYGNM